MSSAQELGEPSAATGQRGPAIVLRGVSVAPGLVVGPAHRKDGDLERAADKRIGRDDAAGELNRFRAALDRSRRQLEDLRGHLAGKVSSDDARVLDTHLVYLRDSAFVSDVEKQILENGLRLEAAVAKVVADFERIFKLVQSERLRQGAVDLRDVGIRVLRNLESDGAQGPRAVGHHVLVARELSIVDMFNLDGEHVAGIVVEEGGLAGHAAVFARSMGIPTLIGVKGLLDSVAEGDALLLDASEGILRVRPDAQILAQYTGAVTAGGASAELDQLRGLPLDALPTAGGAEVRLVAACGNLPEVIQAARTGVAEIGMYRTELLFLADGELPSLAALRAHYDAVHAQARGARVTFRLLSVDSGLGAQHLAPTATSASHEPNPRLGRAGVRLLLAREDILRRQLQALILATGQRRLRIAVPFVLDGTEVARIRAVLEQERATLERSGVLADGAREAIEVGAVIEVPAALFALGDLAQQADFLAINLDSLMLHLLAADRQVPELADYFRAPHPAVLGALEHAVRASIALRAPLSVFGPALDDPETALLVAGTGVRTFAAAPMALPALAQAFGQADLAELAAAVGSQTYAAGHGRGTQGRTGSPRASYSGGTSAGGAAGRPR